jgi:uncharacterized membrane protein
VSAWPGPSSPPPSRPSSCRTRCRCARPLRPWLVTQIGARGFTLAYSALSVAIFAWLVGAAGRALFVPLWPWAPWQTHVTLLAMLAVCLVVAFVVLRPNPFSFGGGRAGFDPARPGIVRWLRHPLLAAVVLWAFAHILPNGDLAHVLLFGTFGTFALFGHLLVDRRRRQALGPEWDRLDRAETSELERSLRQAWCRRRALHGPHCDPFAPLRR